MCYDIWQLYTMLGASGSRTLKADRDNEGTGARGSGGLESSFPL